ncbi:MAG: BatA domain-containing protein [Gemmatimonadaceae bacterium]
MLGFLAPLWLLAGAAAAVPLLIHLLRRRIGTRVNFPAVRYLLRAEREHSRKLRLRNLLLMLLRVAAVLLLALAAARPVLRMAGSGHAPTALAVVLDNSLSSSAVVSGRPVLEGLKARAREVARRAASDDRLWLVTADGRVHGGSAGAVRAEIDRVEPLAGAGNPARALTRATSLVRQAGQPEREVALITDAQATSWRAPLSIGDTRVRAYAPAGPPPPNRGVADAAAIPSRWTPRGAVRARVSTPDSATYRISLEGRTLARGTASRDEEITVRAAPSERGWTGGAVELEPDELRGDDARYFAVWLGPPPAVAVHPALGPFARSAVDALVEAGRITLGGDIALVPADEATRLPALLVAPADPVRLGAANRALERLGVPWRLGALRRGESPVRGERLVGVSASVRYVLGRRAGAAADTLATAGGDAWIVRGPNYVLIASALTPDATTLPVRAPFVPWLDDVVSQALAGGSGPILTATPGATLPRPAGADALELAGGTRSPISGDTVFAPERAGAYFFARGSQRVGALVVNPEPEESALDRLSPTALAALLRGRDVRVLADTAALSAAVFASAPRRPVVLPLLVIALATLVTESVIAGGTRGRAT